MSEKATCPGCNSHTSALMAVLRGEEDQCPYCGLSAAAMIEVIAVQDSRASEQMNARISEAIVARDRAEQRAAKAEATLQRLRRLFDEVSESVPRGQETSTSED